MPFIEPKYYEKWLVELWKYLQKCVTEVCEICLQEMSKTTNSLLEREKYLWKDWITLLES